MFGRIKSTKTLKGGIGAIIIALASAFLLPEDHNMHLAMGDALMVVVIAVQSIFLRDGTAKMSK